MSQTPPAPDAGLPTAVTEPVVTAAVTAALEAIAAAPSTAELKQVRISHLGDDAPITVAGRSMREVPKEHKAATGKLVGESKGRISKALAARQEELTAAEQEQALATETVDVTLPTDRRPRGALHPLTALTDRIEDFFIGIGWEIAEGPEIESSWMNFDALNADPEHPSRSLQDTLYLAPEDSGMLLRTQTSPVQIRAMLERGAPLYVACPGTVYRADEIDATHSPMFHQVEGLAIDENLTMANLVGTLDAFAAHLFGGSPVTRLRPNHFPFTEPSAEMDFRCFSCEARLGTDHDPAPDCRVCGGTGWIEMGGCGMVHPDVLRAAGVDPERYQGFAFGLGIERLLMLRNGVADMRDMIEGDVRFSQHYGTEI
ncbi:phenylalanine--tRNA ligase subunit alpha [Brachybacterium sp. UMB0905]|uniref:phenylalanine--tRNA ligase subunit alpha n=1 Tax=Brachybacterium sp. UMB0905 TaxID=2069310 RepID=UPI001303FE4F|nr:phenylalanine--tRNA ligase subunit alpha [Brachybacterium sp. UMB0905]